MKHLQMAIRQVENINIIRTAFIRIHTSNQFISIACALEKLLNRHAYFQSTNLTSKYWYHNIWKIYTWNEMVIGYIRLEAQEKRTYSNYVSSGTSGTSDVIDSGRITTLYSKLCIFISLTCHCQVFPLSFCFLS